MDEHMKPVGMIRPKLQELPQIQTRMTFLYLEKCQLSREDNAIAFANPGGIVHIPAASITVLMLGPGATVTHRAMELIGDAGVTVLWVGESGVRYYASGKPMTHRAGLILRQAALVSNTRALPRGRRLPAHDAAAARPGREPRPPVLSRTGEEVGRPMERQGVRSP